MERDGYLALWAFVAVAPSLLTNDLALAQPPAAGDLTTNPQQPFIPDLMFARKAENPVSRITRVPVADCGIPLEKLGSTMVDFEILPGPNSAAEVEDW